MKLAIYAAMAVLASAALPAFAYSVPKTRLDRLASGANVTQWFQVYSPQPDSHYRDYMSDDEMALIRRLGLQHVRLCVSPQYLYEPTDPIHPIAAHLADLEAAI